MIEIPLGEIVKFYWRGRTLHYGFVVSIEKGIANIKGIEQACRSRPEYHYPIEEIQRVSTKVAFELGRHTHQAKK